MTSWWVFWRLEFLAPGVWYLLPPFLGISHSMGRRPSKSTCVNVPSSRHTTTRPFVWTNKQTAIWPPRTTSVYDHLLGETMTEKMWIGVCDKSLQKMVYGLKHHTVEIVGGVADAGRKDEHGKIGLLSLGLWSVLQYCCPTHKLVVPGSEICSVFNWSFAQLVPIFLRGSLSCPKPLKKLNYTETWTY